MLLLADKRIKSYSNCFSDVPLKQRYKDNKNDPIQTCTVESYNV